MWKMFFDHKSQTDQLDTFEKDNFSLIELWPAQSNRNKIFKMRVANSCVNSKNARWPIGFLIMNRRQFETRHFMDLRNPNTQRSIAMTCNYHSQGFQKEVETMQ
jgi:hypothetical protein